MSTEGATQWRQERRLEQEQKAKQLQDALESASTPEDRAAAAAAIYGPSAFKQHAENLFGRLIGRAPQPVVSPYAAPSVTTPSSTLTPSDSGTGDTVGGQPAPTKAAPGLGDDSQLPALPSPTPAFPTPAITVQGPAPNSRAQALAGVLARGTTENQRALALHGAELTQGNEASVAGLTAKEAAFHKLAQGKSPAEQRQIAQLFGMQPRMTQREYTGPNGERQWLYPDEAQEMGWTATQGTGVAKVIQLDDGSGNPVPGIERDGKVFDASGKQLLNPKMYIKPGSVQPKAGTATGPDGKATNAYAVATKEGWRNTNAPFNILPDFKPMATFAQTGLFGLEPWQNADGSMGSALMNRRTGKFQVLSSTNGAPIDPRMLAVATKNMEPALESDTRFRVMKDSEDAAKRGDQQAQLNILANHLGMTQGLQKGARITQTLMSEAIASAPGLDRVISRGFHKDPDTGDYVFDGYKTGVTLTPDQIDQMVSLGQKRRVRQWQQAQQAGQMVGVNVPIPGDLENPSETLKAPKQTGPAPKSAKSSGDGPNKIKIGDKTYTYNGTGDRANLKNYTEVKK